MEFNTLTLRPTYKLCWGVAGASNALAIARTLSFDSAVVREAEKVGASQQAGCAAPWAPVAGAGALESSSGLRTARLSARQAARRHPGPNLESLPLASPLSPNPGNTRGHGRSGQPQPQRSAGGQPGR
jgi:hypothetical protein